jgi:hypothetical protein
VSRASRFGHRRLALALMSMLCLPVMGYELTVLWSYSTTPGRRATAALEWPSHSGVTRSPGRSTLLLFAHPQCTCTYASLTELTAILANSAGALEAVVLFSAPSEEPESWVESDLWQAAKQIPGVQVRKDPDNRIAQSFGVYTSGQSLVYTPRGKLIFNGGITPVRGHAGDSAAVDAIIELVRRSGTDPATSDVKLPLTAAVFGCSLRGESR